MEPTPKSRRSHASKLTPEEREAARARWAALTERSRPLVDKGWFGGASWTRADTQQRPEATRYE